jgi:hypothetical protein
MKPFQTSARISTKANRWLALALSMVVTILTAAAQEERDIAVSPKTPWGNFDLVVEEEPHWSRTALLWLPNRVLDFIDIFRGDIGVGNSWGAAVKATEFVQLGYRKMNPNSYRLGMFGRMEPFITEKGYEGGVSTYYHLTEGRPNCPTELGASLDILFVGAHLGVCSEEVWDFIAGLATFDSSEDDLT